MKDYAAERYYRDARITSIYEGTSQLQVVAAIRGLTSGVYNTYLEEFEAKEYGDEALDALKARLITAHAKLNDAVAFARDKGAAYVELRARKIVDVGVAILIGHYLLGQAAKNARKKKVADYFIVKALSDRAASLAAIQNGSTHVLDDYLEFVGPVSELE